MDYDKIKLHIKQSRYLKENPHRARLSRRLLNLLKWVREEEPETWKFSVKSVDALLFFTWKYKPLFYPDIGLSPNGTLMAQWKDKTRNLIIEFISSKQVLFCAVVGNRSMYGRKSFEQVWNIIQKEGI